MKRRTFLSSLIAGAMLHVIPRLKIEAAAPEVLTGESINPAYINAPYEIAFYTSSESIKIGPRPQFVEPVIFKRPISKHDEYAKSPKTHIRLDADGNFINPYTF